MPVPQDKANDEWLESDSVALKLKLAQEKIRQRQELENFEKSLNAQPVVLNADEEPLEDRGW